MPVKTKAAINEPKVSHPDSDIHHMIRRISDRPTQGSISADEADMHARNWLQAGYELHSVQSLGLEPGVINILYIFVKYE